MSMFKLLVYNLLKTKKTLLFICIHTVVFFLYISSLNFRPDFYMNQDQFILFSSNDFDERFLSYFAVSLYFITGGALLWSFILFDLFKFFRSNDEKGILLTHIVNPISRTSYYIRVVGAIYFTYLMLTLFNLLISFSIVVFIIGIFHFKFIFLGLAFLLYVVVSSLLLLLCFSLLFLILRQNELSILSCFLIITINQVSFVINDVLFFVQFRIGNILYTMFNLSTSLYLYFINRLRVFSLYKYSFNLESTHLIDPDLNFITSSDIHDQFISEWIALVITLVSIILLLFMNIIRFNRIEISGY